MAFVRWPRLAIGIALVAFAAYAASVNVQPASAVDCTATTSAELATHLADPSCDRVIVQAGTYTGPFDIKRPVEVLGPNAGTPADGTRGPEAQINSAGHGFRIAVQPDDVVKIDGVSIDADGVGLQSVIDATVAGDTNNTNPDPGPAPNFGQMETDMSVTVVNNLIDGGEEGLGLIDGGALTVQDNEIDAAEDGVRVRELQELSSTHCEVHVPAQDFNHDGVLVTTGTGADTTPGNADDEKVCLLHTRGEVTVSDNDVNSSGEDGLDILHTGKVTAAGNSLAADEDGAHLRDVHGVGHSISGNTVSSAGDEALFLEDLKGTSIPENPTIAGADGQVNFQIDGAANIANNRIEASGAAAEDSDTDRPASPRGTSDEEDRDCNESGGSDGILLCDVKARPLATTGNTLVSTKHDGVVLSDVKSQELSVSENTVNSAGDDGILLTNSSSRFQPPVNTGPVSQPGGTPDFTIDGTIEVSRNRIEQTGASAQGGNECPNGEANAIAFCDIKANPTRVADNVIPDSAADGIFAQDVKKNTQISGNQVTSTAGEAIDLRDVSTEVSGNQLSGGETHGIRVEGTNGTTVSGNNIQNFPQDAVHLGPEAGDVETGSKSVAVNGNTIRGAGRAGINYGQVYGDGSISGNDIQTSGTPGPGGAIHIRDLVKTDTFDLGVPVVTSHTLSIRSNNLAANSAGIRGGSGVDLGASGGSIVARFNRIFTNTAGIPHEGAGTIDAINNWFGCNEGPGAPGCDGVSGPVSFNPWLVLGLTANPTSIPTGGAQSTLLATMTGNSAGQAVGPGFPDGFPVSFSTTFSSTGGASRAETRSAPALGAGSGNTSGGEVPSTLTSGSETGKATVTGKLDNGTANAEVAIVGVLAGRLDCINFRPGVGARRLGPAELGRSRASHRRIFRGAFLRARGGIDRWCIAGGGSLRIGYPTARLNRRVGHARHRRLSNRAILALTTSRRYSIRRIRVGSSVRTLRRRLRGERRFRVDRNTWYLATARRSRLLFKTRRGRVLELGLSSKPLTRSRGGAKRFLRAWELPR